MSAPVTDLSFSSVSSSGHVDGLGRRSLSFDRETGAMLERLHVRPELAVFEVLLRQRVAHLSSIQEERFARPLAVERDASSGDLVVVAEFVTGSRLSELLDVSADEAVVPGVDVALGYLLESLPALNTLHTSNRAVHGLIDPSRTIVTAEGQVVFLDLAFGPALERLNPTSQRLWTDFGVPLSSASRPLRFGPADDVTQVALGALMLVLGRNLRPEEYPDALPNLVMEVIEVAHIRGSTAFATGLQRILQSSLPIPGRRPYATADEMLVDVRQIVRKEIGLDVCRQAVIDFVAQMDAAFATATPAPERTIAPARSTATSLEPHVPELDHFLDTFEIADDDEIRTLSRDARGDAIIPDEPEEDAFDEDDEDETELSFDQAEPAAAPQRLAPAAEEVYDLAALDDPASLSSELASFDVRRAQPAPERAMVPAVEDVPVVEEVPSVRNVPEVEEAPSADLENAAEEIEAAAVQESPDEDAPESRDDASVPEPEAQHQSGSSRRRKRQQMKSARARKDKLRSTSDPKPTPPAAPPPPPPPPKPASPSGWHVSPHRAAPPEPLVPEHVPMPIPQPQPQRTVHVPVSFTPSPVGPLPQPTYTNPSPSGIYGSPTVAAKPQPSPLAPPPVQPPPPPALKIKTDPPAGFNATRRTLPEPSVAPPPDRFSTLSLGGNADAQEAPREFPWRLAAIAVAVAVVAIMLGRTYLPGRTAVTGEPGAPTENAAAPTPPPVAPPDPKNESPIPSGKGRVTIQTQPAGIKVLLDRKPIGETPVQIDTTPGRHVLTFLTSGGEVMHSVRVTAGKATVLDLPVFSGWLSVFAPILLDVAEGGRSLGTTEQNRLMLPPGRHELTFNNKDFGFSETRAVDIEPGGVRNVTIEARGTANINASPWAEVWLDGTKLGETPLAGTPVPLGLREFVFKHPQHGERKVSATIRANTPAQISVDFTK